MTTDFNSLTIPIFPGINDLPTAPTASKAGNGSHLIDTINKLIVELSKQPSHPIVNWSVIRSDATLEINSKNLIFVDNITQPLIATLPDNPSAGNFVTLIKVRPNTICKLGLYLQVYGLGNGEVTLEALGEELTLVYVDYNLGWITSKPNMLSIVSQPN